MEIAKITTQMAPPIQAQNNTIDTVTASSLNQHLESVSDTSQQGGGTKSNRVGDTRETEPDKKTDSSSKEPL